MKVKEQNKISQLKTWRNQILKKNDCGFTFIQFINLELEASTSQIS